MKAIHFVLAIALPALWTSPARAEECVASPMDAASDFQFPRVTLDLGSGAKLDPAALPPGTAAILCPRPSLVPLADDIRVLLEWNVAFGILEPGQRMLWVSATAGRLQITVDDGELNAAEQAAVDAWVATSQARFTAALTRR